MKKRQSDIEASNKKSVVKEQRKQHILNEFDNRVVNLKSIDVIDIDGVVSQKNDTSNDEPPIISFRDPLQCTEEPPTTSSDARVQTINLMAQKPKSRLSSESSDPEYFSETNGTNGIFFITVD